MYRESFLAPFSTQEPNYGGDEAARENNAKRDKNKKEPRLTLDGMTTLKRRVISGMGNRGNSNSRQELTRVKPDPEDEIKVKQSVLDDFISSYNKNRMNSQVVNDLILDNFVDVCDIMTHYFDNKYSKIVESMNNVLKVMETKVFATRLSALIKQQENFSDEFRSNLAELISLTLESRHSVMADDTKIMYAEIMKEHLFSFDIADMMERFRLSEEAALDLVIGLPLFGKTINDATIARYAEKYVELLINHADTMIDYMTAEAQKELFYYIFKDANGIALKAVGRCLSHELIAFDNDKMSALYTEFIKMLYLILDEHDISEIRFVLKFIVKVMSERVEAGKELPIVYSTETASACENIKKAIVNYAETSEAAKRFLSIAK